MRVPCSEAPLCVKVCRPEACSSRWFPFFFRPPIRGHLEQDTLAPLTRAPPPWSLRSRDLSYFSAADGARSDKGWGGRSRLPGTPPAPETGAARRAPQLRAGPPARPPATAGTNRRAARPLGGGNFWERGGVRCGRAGRRSGRRPRSPSGRGGAPRASVAGWGGPRASARPPARATTSHRARRRARGTLEHPRRQEFHFPNPHFSNALSQCGAVARRPGEGNPELGRGGGMRGDSGDPRVARGVRVSSRPGCRCTRAPAVPTRPSRGRSAASDVGGGGREMWGEAPGTRSGTSGERLSPPEQAGSGEVGRGGEGGIRERRRRAAGGPRGRRGV